MEEKRSKIAVFLAGCVCLFFTGEAHAFSRSLACFVGTGVQDSEVDIETGTSYGVSCRRGRLPSAYIFCPGAGSSLQCTGTYRATADSSGIVCFDSGGAVSVDSPRYCDRWGGGGGGCALVFQGPQETVAVNLDGEPRPSALPKSSVVLGRTEAGEDNITFQMEEWAVVRTLPRPGEPEPGLQVLKASSPAFASAVKLSDPEWGELAPSKRSWTEAAASGETVLIVEAPVHPHNSRFAPKPTLELADTEVPPGLSPTRVLVRADFFEKEDSPRQVQVLHADGPAPQQLAELLKGRLSLDWKSMNHHRTIVFATITVGETLEVKNLATVMPKCCCGGFHCI